MPSNQFPTDISALDPETPFDNLVPLTSFNKKVNATAIDPNEKFEDYKTLGEKRTEQHQERLKQTAVIDKDAMDKQNIKEPFWKTIILSQVGIATLSALAAAGLLFIINPPITQKSRIDNETSERQDWRYVLFVCALVFFLVFAMPEVLRLFKLFD